MASCCSPVNGVVCSLVSAPWLPAKITDSETWATVRRPSKCLPERIAALVFGIVDRLSNAAMDVVFTGTYMGSTLNPASVPSKSETTSKVGVVARSSKVVIASNVDA